MSLEDKMEEDKEFFKKFTVDYKNLSQIEKDGLDFTKAPCNIWGYIQKLEERIKVLEAAKKG